MNVTDRIEQLRKQKNWSVYKLCNEADITQSTLTNMYARGTYPSLATLINICKAFGITLSEFFDKRVPLSFGQAKRRNKSHNENVGGKINE